MDISNKAALLAAIFLNIGGFGLDSLGIQVLAWPLLGFSVFGIILVFIDNHLKNKQQKLYQTASQKKDDSRKILSPEAIEILRVIAAMLSPFGNNRQEATIDEIALSETFGMSHQQTKYLLELLNRADMLKTNDIGIYGIKHKGRKLLNKKKKMP